MHMVEMGKLWKIKEKAINFHDYYTTNIEADIHWLTQNKWIIKSAAQQRNLNSQDLLIMLGFNKSVISVDQSSSIQS